MFLILWAFDRDSQSEGKLWFCLHLYHLFSMRLCCYQFNHPRVYCTGCFDFFFWGGWGRLHLEVFLIFQDAWTLNDLLKLHNIITANFDHTMPMWQDRRQKGIRAAVWCNVWGCICKQYMLGDAAIEHYITFKGLLYKSFFLNTVASGICNPSLPWTNSFLAWDKFILSGVGAASTLVNK